MNYKALGNRELAVLLAENTEKEGIIPAIFDLFRLDCIERCNSNPVELDTAIRKFNESQGADIDVLEEIIRLVRVGQGITANKENQLVKDIALCIQENLTDDISIEEMAQKLNISYYYMCHIFKEKNGDSVSVYRNKKRMEIAMRRLIETEERIADIALACGFNNISYFTELFTKMVGCNPSNFRTLNKDKIFLNFYTFEDMLLTTRLENLSLMADDLLELERKFETVSVYEPDERYSFLHEAAIIEFKGVLYASWYNCPKAELRGHTPICGKRSYDKGKSWTELEVLCEDSSDSVLYCPPVYGITDGKLYMMVNQMTAPDHMHSMDLYVLNEETDKFEFLWSRPIPFKLNTNAVALPNGKLMLPGRIGELDGFPNTPAVLISDSGKMDGEWRLVKIAENGDLPDGKKLVHPEISVMSVDNVLYMFCRNDQRRVPLVYVSKDFGESWSGATATDIPFVSTKIYAGDLSDGRKFFVANTNDFSRCEMAVYFTEKNSRLFNKRLVLYDKDDVAKRGKNQCHYPSACEYDGKLYILATLGREWMDRGAILFIVDLAEI